MFFIEDSKGFIYIGLAGGYKEFGITVLNHKLKIEA